MGKSYTYHNEGSRHGQMICGACSRTINAGQYRVRETAEKYITHHRACCADDPQWGRLDGDAARWVQKQQAMLAAAIEFRDRWHVTDLDELIADHAHLAAKATSPDSQGPVS